MRNKNASTTHPKSSGWAGWPAAVPWLCLCKGMGWLALKAQVHPGLSGFEKMDFSQIHKHALLRIPLEAGLRLHPPDHVVVQARVHIHVHVIAKRLNHIQVHFHRRRSTGCIYGALDVPEIQMLRAYSQYHM